MFYETGSDFITYFQSIDIYMRNGLGLLRVTGIIMSKCVEICVSPVSELGRGYHSKGVPCGVLCQLGLFQVEGSH